MCIRAPQKVTSALCWVDKSLREKNMQLYSGFLRKFIFLCIQLRRQRIEIYLVLLKVLTFIASDCVLNLRNTKRTQDYGQEYRSPRNICVVYAYRVEVIVKQSIRQITCVRHVCKQLYLIQISIEVAFAWQLLCEWN